MSEARAEGECGRCKEGDAGDPLGSPKQPDAADAVLSLGEARSDLQTSVAKKQTPQYRSEPRGLVDGRRHTCGPIAFGMFTSLTD